MIRRDARWETKYAVPTVTTEELLSLSEPVYLYVDNSDADTFSAWDGSRRFTENKTLPGGVVYEMERP